MPRIGLDGLEAAAEQGRICALALACQRDLADDIGRYPELFPPDRFGPSLLAGLSLANAFGSPWASAEQLRFVTRVSVWVFAADWQVDGLAKTRNELDDIVLACLKVADGEEGNSAAPLARYLAEIRAELAAAPAFDSVLPVWRDRLRRFLLGMVREWEWRTAVADGGNPPGLDEYLRNSDSTAASFVNVSHWIFTDDREALAHLAELVEAGEMVQRVLRLMNDLASRERDLASGDLNALTLGAGYAEVTAVVAELVDRCRELIRPLRTGCPRAADYLERQIGFSAGFYRLTDYWSAR